MYINIYKLAKVLTLMGTEAHVEVRRLTMSYEPTRLLDIDYVIAHTIPSSEVHSSGEGIYAHKPFTNRGVFGLRSSILES